MNARFAPEAVAPQTEASFETGLYEYKVNGIPVRVNLNDKGVIRRLSSLPDVVGELLDKYEEESKELEERIDIKSIPMKPGETGPAGVDFSAVSDEQVDAISDRTKFLLDMDHAVDKRIKACLAEAFCAPDTDIQAMFQGVSALALDRNGNYILTNFMKAIYPLLEEANKIEAKEVDDLVGNRAARRARNQSPDSVQS